MLAKYEVGQSLELAEEVGGVLPQHLEPTHPLISLLPRLEAYVEVIVLPLQRHALLEGRGLREEARVLLEEGGQVVG